MPSTWSKVLGNIAAAVASLGSAPRAARGTGSDRVHLLLVCTAERGLCGPFNSAIVRLARERANTLIAEGKEVKFFCVGRKGYEQLRRHLREADHRAHRAARRCARSASQHAEDDRRQDRAALRGGRVRRLHAVLLALQVGDRADSDRRSRSFRRCSRTRRGSGDGAAYEYEPEEEEILAELLPRNIAVQIFRALLENTASFYGAQMSAMDNATRNAGDMIRKQTLIYNRTRQAMITKELIEIISGAEAL